MTDSGSPPRSGLSDSEMLRLLMDSHTDHIYFKDEKSRFIRINSALARWFGLDDPAQAIGKTDFDFFTEEHAREAFQDEARVMATGIPIIGKIEMETWPDGRRTWVSTTKLPIRDENRRIIGTFGVSRDVTEQYLQREKLARAVEELRKVNERYREELALASDVMSALSANRLETFPERNGPPRLRFHYRYSAAEQLSGDFFVVASYNSQSAIIFLCDVMGHGISAALIAAILRVWVGQMVRAETPPAGILTTLNRRVHSLFSEPEILRFATAFCGVIDVSQNTLRYACAGHPSPILIDPNFGKARALYDSRSKEPGLGLQPNTVYAECEEVMPLGSLLMVYSDGLLEYQAAREGAITPEIELCEQINRYFGLQPDAIINDVFTRAQAAARTGVSDDICIVAAEMIQSA
ncbi:MAG: SpoIIE family protein phosphatase [Kiritimatiellae bacterium]|nr:SpoIIE family protein phosphatase [Kiritimatiellia bacterium]MDW8459098.1 SpoIIE family protein phosphatase [Verrucomicrobiota bacterium]